MLQLYLREGCPYCRKVLAAAQQMGLAEGKDFTVIDSGPGAPGEEVVLRVGGKDMVPFLIDEQLSMYESEDIITYMAKKFGRSRP